MWSRPIVSLSRSGFEITGYALSTTVRRAWTVPSTLGSTRSGFEVTAYALSTKDAAWTVPSATASMRSGFEITGYALTK